MPLNFKLGRKPARFTHGSLKRALFLASRFNDLPPAPLSPTDYCAAVDKAVGGNENWRMFKNDVYSDCTYADGAHQIMLHTANASAIYIPSDTECLAAYSEQTGFDPKNLSSDEGAVESEVCDYMTKTGIAGHKSSSHAPINPHTAEHLKWAVQMFGGCRLGMMVPVSCERQFDKHQPWDVVPGATIDGGHDVYLTSYETLKDGSTMWFVCTWGVGRHPMTDAFRLKYVEEAHGEIYYDWIKQGGTAPSGFKIDELQNTLASIHG